ncbi:Signal transduction histidine kinase [Streptomyces sp. WMMB 714]|uniref:ATP-binding protein n=1 Tax=Streptomyces sp. WMMB 714 TaxID=1286822 RepID=UPI000823850F|nr:ATP-binding protein [Streptomyces sp. WMMB 714]SCK40343.1 Signal transduction histidine kinase [Streptomyces sp. WMMB 714]
MTETPVALIVFLTAGTVAAVVLALLFVLARKDLSRLRRHSGAVETQLHGATRQNADLGARLRAVEEEFRHLAQNRIPDLATSLRHRNVPVRGPLGSGTLTPEIDRSISAVLGQVSEEVVKERQRVDFAAQAAMRGSTTTIQALLYQLQSLLQRMQEKYEDPLVAEDLLSADFLNEQALRRIQSTAVVCGAWPGLTRENSHLADIVVGAMSRLSGYERVQVTNQLRDPVGVVARAVEPVAVTLTELMANALHYSHPDLPVVVTIQQGNRGVSVIIDDAGVGMHSDELERARRMVSGEETVLMTDLGDPPRIGFAAIGQLVQQYGFSTHLESSPYGGVRAIVHVPGEPLLTLLDEEEKPMSAMAPAPPERASLPGRAGADGFPLTAASALLDGPDADAVPDELPRRRRRRPVQADSGPAEVEAPARTGRTGPEDSGAATAASTSPSRPASTDSTPDAAPARSAPPTSPEESADIWAAFQQGTASGRAAAGVDDGLDTGGDPGPDAGLRAGRGSSAAGSDDSRPRDTGGGEAPGDGASPDAEHIEHRTSEGNPPA